MTMDSDLLEKMTAMENRALMWQADLDQELQRLNTEISQVLQDTAPSPAAEQLALWRKELRQTRQFLVETLKLLTEKDAETLVDTKQPKEDVTRAKLAIREMELQQREEALQAKEKKLQMVKDQETQPAFSSALLAKERELLDFKDKQLLEREQALQREKQLQQDREHSFHAREKLLLDRELTLQEEKKLHQERERQQQEREESLQAQRKLQQEREESLDAKDRQLRSAPAPVVPAPEAAKAPRRAPKRKAEPPPKGPPLPQNRSSRSRERVEEDKRPKTKRRKVPYVTFEELRWDWLKSHSPEVLAVPAETVEELDLLQALKAPQSSVPSELPWDTDLMVELDEVAPPQPISADAELMVELEEAPPEFREAPAPVVKPKPQAEIEESYLVDGLTEEDLFDVEEEAAAEYMPPSPKMNAKKPPPKVRSPVLAESEAPGAAAAAGAAKNKKKDWYQRHYPGQVAPREQRETSQRWQRPRQNGFKPPGRAGAAVPRPQELDWAYEPLKGQSKTNDGLFPQLSDSLPSIDDVLPSL